VRELGSARWLLPRRRGNPDEDEAELGNARRGSFFAVQGRARVAIPRREGAQGGARRGRANGDGAEQLGVCRCGK
jgi:hypothetical protein